jgi:predicted acyltransferase
MAFEALGGTEYLVAMTNPTLAANPAEEIQSDSTQKRGNRLLSLDILRGITIAFMIMVNNNGGRDAWAQMHHADWNGLTATDLVFPTFLFVVGISIVYSIEARLAKGARRAELAWHTFTRAVILILFGIVVNSFPHFHLQHMRFYGVLQRIAVCYLVVGLFYLFDRRVWTKAVMLVAVLLGYWVLVRWVPVPGAGMPVRDVPLLDRNQNIVAWVDRQVMPGHLYEDAPTFNERDPEGLLSDLPALGTTLLGLLTALWVRSPRSHGTKVLGLAAATAVCLNLGYYWDTWFPLNKKMWTSSYVLAAAGWSLALFWILFWLVEMRGWGRGNATGEGDVIKRAVMWPWIVFGLNAIAAYMVSELLPGLFDLLAFQADGRKLSALAWMRIHVFGQIPNPAWACFAYSFSYMVLCFIPVWILYRKRIFLKV